MSSARARSPPTSPVTKLVKALACVAYSARTVASSAVDAAAVRPTPIKRDRRWVGSPEGLTGLPPASATRERRKALYHTAMGHGQSFDVSQCDRCGAQQQ